jgi:hypothetical protein
MAKMCEPQIDADLEIAEQAEKETLAQLAIIRLMKPLTQEQRGRVFRAILHLLEADKLVPGVIDAFRQPEVHR